MDGTPNLRIATDCNYDSRNRPKASQNRPVASTGVFGYYRPLQKWRPAGSIFVAFRQPGW
jgi:hypothetical protein